VRGGHAPPNKSMDVRQKQQLFKTVLLNFCLRVAGFCPRHLKRSPASLESEDVSVIL